jgi:hypothetical protein
MKKNDCLWMILFMLVNGNALAYGGGGSSSAKACAKPKFSEFKPAENAEVAPGSAFSFSASKNTYPNTLKVTVKGKPASIQTTPQNDGTFEVNGKLPSEVKGTFARISIVADAQSNCNGTGGWLVKISE